MSGKRVNFRFVRQAVTMPMVLGRYDTALAEDSRGQWRGPCPIHKGSNQNQFVVTPPNKWHCFGDCAHDVRFHNGGGNTLDFVRGMEGIDTGNAGQDTYQTALLIIDWFNLGQDAYLDEGEATPPKQPVCTRWKQMPAVATPTAKSEPPATLSNPPLERGGTWFLNRDYEYPYLIEARGLTSDITRYFGVGHYTARHHKGSMHNRCVIPIHNADGNIVAFVGRWPGDDPPEGEGKYKLPKGFRKSLELFNLHRVPKDAKSVVLVEGYFDVFKLHQCGIPNVVAAMGASLSDWQQALLCERFYGVQVFFDGDKTGREGSAAVASQLIRQIWVKVIECPEGSQPEHLSQEALQALVM